MIQALKKRRMSSKLASMRYFLAQVAETHDTEYYRNTPRLIIIKYS